MGGVKIADDWIREPDPDELSEEDQAFVDQMDERTEFAKEVAHEAHRIKVRDEARRRVAREERDQLERPHLVSLDEFLARPLDDPTYRVDNLWPTGGRVLLSAQWKAGKTTLTGNLIRALADGTPFLDQFEVRPAQRIVLIDNELDDRTLQRWLTDQRVTNTPTVHLLPLRGRVSTFDIFDTETRAEWAKELAGADIIVLDCLRPIFDAFGLDENHEAGKFLVAFDTLLADIGHTEAVVVHHMGHGPERSRGDSRLMDWPDALWKLVRDKDDEDEGMDDPSGARYFSAFGRDVDHPQAELAYDPDTRHLTLGNNALNRRLATAHRKVVKTEETVLTVVTEQPGLNKTKLRAACAAQGCHNPDTDAAVERLIQRGLVRRQINGQSHFHYPGEAMLAQFGQPDPQPTLPTVPNRAHDTLGTVAKSVDNPVDNPPETPTVPTVPNSSETPGTVTVPVPIGARHGNRTPNPAHEQWARAGSPDQPTDEKLETCPHGMPGGNKPDTFVNGRLACPQCATQAEQ